jgi:hypothetical protein
MRPDHVRLGALAAAILTLIDFGSKEARDAAVATGITDGMEQSYQRLDTLFSECV